MSSIYDWVTTAADNDDADSEINWAEGQPPSSVNNSARAMMMQTAYWRQQLTSQCASAGSSNAYTVTTGQSLASLPAGFRVAFTANHASTGAATLAVDGLTAVNLKKNNDQDIASGDIEVGQIVEVIYDGTNFQVVSDLATGLDSGDIGSSIQAWSADLDTYSSNPLTAVELQQLQNIGTSTISASQWGYVGAISAYGASLIDDADAATARTTLGLGSIATQAASSVAITGGAIDGTAIGGTTPAAGAFTTLTASSTTTLNGAASFNAQAGIQFAFNDSRAFAAPFYINNTNASASLIAYEWQNQSVRRFADLVDFSDGRQIRTYNSSGSYTGTPFQIAPDAPDSAFAIQADGDVIMAAGNVGIGTTSPSTTLDVAGNAAVDDNLTISRSGVAPALVFQNSSYGGGDATITMFNSGDLIFNTNATEAMRIDASGNVGIGTTSPDTLLDLRPIVYTTNQLGGISLQTTGGQLRWDIAVGTSGTGAGFFRITEPSDVLGNTHTIAEHLSDEWAFHTAGSERVRIDSSGNVGIGTTSPGSDLDVEGITTLGLAATPDATRALTVERGGGAITGVAKFRSTLTNVAADVLIIDQDNSSTRAALQIQGNAGATEVLFAASNGNVGIGTTAPNASLDVRGTGLFGNGNGSYNIDVGADGTNAFLRAENMTTAFLLGTRDATNLQLITNDTIRATIDSTGSVGIGTTSPSALLHVRSGASGGTASVFADDVVIEGNTTTGLSIISPDVNSAQVYLGSTTDPDAARIRWNQADALMTFQAAGGEMQLSVGSLEVIRLDSSGNVGIATTGPNVELDVNGQLAARQGAKLTIVSGAITVTHSFHEIQSQTVGADNLDTINGGHDGAILVLRAESGVEEAITLTNSGNIIGPVGTISGDDAVTLMYDGTRSAWIILSRT